MIDAVTIGRPSPHPAGQSPGGIVVRQHGDAIPRLEGRITLIKISSFLRPRFQRMLPQYHAFLDDIGVPASHYNIASEPQPGGVLVATYGADDFETASYATLVRVAAGPSVAIFRTGLDSALFTAASILTDRGLQMILPPWLSKRKMACWRIFTSIQKS